MDEVTKMGHVSCLCAIPHYKIQTHQIQYALN